MRFCVKTICSGVIIRVISATKFRSMDTQVLFCSFRAKITQSTTAITSIAITLTRIDYESSVNLKYFVIARRCKRRSNPHNQKFLFRFAFAKSRNPPLLHHYYDLIIFADLYAKIPIKIHDKGIKCATNLIVRIALRKICFFG